MRDIVFHRQAYSVDVRKQVNNYNGRLSELWASQVGEAAERLTGLRPSDFPDELEVHIGRPTKPAGRPAFWGWCWPGRLRRASSIRGAGGWRRCPSRRSCFSRSTTSPRSILSDEGHPWSVIGEFFRPIAEGIFEESVASYAFRVLLGLAGAGMLAAAACRRWGHLLILAAMTATAISMRRNIAPAPW